MGAGASAGEQSLSEDDVAQLAAVRGVHFDPLEFRRSFEDGDGVTSEQLQQYLAAHPSLPCAARLNLSLWGERVAWQLEDGEAPTSTLPGSPLKAPVPNTAPALGCDTRCFELPAPGSELALDPAVPLALDADGCCTLALWLKLPHPAGVRSALAVVSSPCSPGDLVALDVFETAAGRRVYRCGVIDPDGTFVPAVSDSGGLDVVDVLPDRWTLIVAALRCRRSGGVVVTETSFHTAWDGHGLRHAGAVSTKHAVAGTATPSEVVVAAVGGGSGDSGLGTVSEVHAWCTALPEGYTGLDQVFGSTATKYGIKPLGDRTCMLLARFGITKAAPSVKDAAEAKESQCEGEPDAKQDDTWNGHADFTGLDLVMSEFQLVMDTAATRTAMTSLSLAGNPELKGPGWCDPLLALLEDSLPPGLRSLDVSGLDFSGMDHHSGLPLEEVLLEATQRARALGVSIVAEGCNLSDQAVAELRNSSEDAHKAAEVRAVELAESAAQEAEYEALQAQVQQMWTDVDNGLSPLPIPTSSGVSCVPPVVESGAPGVSAGDVTRELDPFWEWYVRNHGEKHDRVKGKMKKKMSGMSSAEMANNLQIFQKIVSPFVRRPGFQLLETVPANEGRDAAVPAVDPAFENFAQEIWAVPENRPEKLRTAEMDQLGVELGWKHLAALRWWHDEQIRKAKLLRVDSMHRALAERFREQMPGLVADWTDSKREPKMVWTEVPDECPPFVNAEFKAVGAATTDDPVNDDKGTPNVFPDVKRFWAALKEQLNGNNKTLAQTIRKQKMNRLAAGARSKFDNTGAKAEALKLARRGSGQIMAHFAYLSRQMHSLLPPAHFGLKYFAERPPPREKNAVPLHAAIDSGRVTILQAQGVSFGKNALRLTLQGQQSGPPITVLVRAGTIFQHKDWVHKQNLCVISNAKIKLDGKEDTIASAQINAHCLNSQCSCSAGEFMELTDFYFDGPALGIQGRVWNWFNSRFDAGAEAKADTLIQLDREGAAEEE